MPEGEASSTNSSHVEQSAVPVGSRTVDGGDAREIDLKLSEAQRQLEQQQAAYKGMQTNYNKLFEQTQAKDSELNAMQEQIATLQRQIQEMSGQTETVGQQLEQQRSTAEELESRLTEKEREAAMFRLIATKYPSLSAIAETLSPRETAEATDEMLRGFNEMVSRAVQNQLAQSAASATPGGSFVRGGEVTPSSLRKLAIEKAGTPEYEEAANAYYNLIDGIDGLVPKAPPDPYDE